MGNTTVGSVTLDNGASTIITENSCKKESSLAILPLYLSDSDETDVFDYGGVIKTITLSGSFVAATVAELKTWIDSAEALQNGHQDTDSNYPLTFIDDLRGTLKVKVMDFSSTKSAANVTQVTWTIKLAQSSTNA